MSKLIIRIIVSQKRRSMKTTLSEELLFFAICFSGAITKYRSAEAIDVKKCTKNSYKLKNLIEPSFKPISRLRNLTLRQTDHEKVK